MADPKKTTPSDDPDRAKMMRVMIPTVAIGVVVVLVAVVASLTSGSGRKMSDGSNGSADDSGLKEVTAGVKIRDLKEGTGGECPPGGLVKFHYTGWLTDGTVFESSKDPGRGPMEVSLSPDPVTRQGIIVGWQEGIPGMKAGGIRKLVIAPEKAYGTRGLQPKVPPSNTLIYEIELLEVINVVSGLGKPMSDGSNGGTDDPGLKDIGDGLKIRDLKEGTGQPVKHGASVTIHYTGWNVMGKVFDSSHKNGEPVTFELGGLIRGWQEGIPGMKPGGIRKLVVPAALGYGRSARGEHIPAGATLIFEVELIASK